MSPSQPKVHNVAHYAFSDLVHSKSYAIMHLILDPCINLWYIHDMFTR